MPWNIGLKLERDGTYSCILTYYPTEFENTVESFTIPDGVERMRVECWGADAAVHPSATTLGGMGMYIAASFDVVGGQTYDVYAGTRSTTIADRGLRLGGWPDGGDGGDDANAAYYGYGGGGSSSVRLQGSGWADSLVVAGGGGGMAGIAPHPARAGGNAGFYVGDDGVAGWGTGSTGATQFAGGLGGDTAVNGPTTGCSVFTPYQDGTPGTFGQGGEGAGGQVCDLPGPGGWEGGGGGGGGWYGGGGGGGAMIESGEADGGSGGSSWVNPAGYDIASDLSGRTYGNGRVVITLCDVDPQEPMLMDLWREAERVTLGDDPIVITTDTTPFQNTTYDFAANDPMTWGAYGTTVSNSYGHSGYIKFNVETTRDVEIKTVGTPFDTLLSVFVQSGETVDRVPDPNNGGDPLWSDDEGGGGTSLITFEATAGVDYIIGVAGYNPASDYGVVTLTITPL